MQTQRQRKTNDASCHTNNNGAARAAVFNVIEQKQIRPTTKGTKRFMEGRVQQSEEEPLIGYDVCG